jgi:hypothetical protein
MLSRHRVIELVLAGSLLLSGVPRAASQAHWQVPRKESIQVRLIAVSLELPRTSFFANDEVFVAEQELAQDESRFIKLVYDFLPYQTPLSSSGLKYSLVHRIEAVRDTTCDEGLWQMHTAQNSSGTAAVRLQYAPDSPIGDLDRHQARLRCYRVTSDDYHKSSPEPTSEIPY